MKMNRLNKCHPEEAIHMRSTLVTLVALMLSLAISSMAVASEPLKKSGFAYQPLSSPGGALGTTLKHDRILRQAFERAGLTLEIQLTNKGADAIPMLRSGSADIATLGDMPLIEASLSVPLSTIALMKQNYVTVVGDKGILAGDLKGKRIGNALGTTGHFALLKTLASAGLSESDVILVPMEVAEMSDALVQRKIDAFSAWAPTPEATISRYPDRFAAIGRHRSLAFLVVSRRLADKHPELCSHVAAALIRAMNWLKKDKDAVGRVAEWTLEDIRALSGKTPQMSKPQMAKTILEELSAINYSPRLPRGISSEGSTLAEEALFLKKLGKIPADSSWVAIGSSFNAKVIEQVMKQPNAYQLNRFDYDRK